MILQEGGRQRAEMPADRSSVGRSLHSVGGLAVAIGLRITLARIFT
jgi:hypothetical protein